MTRTTRLDVLECQIFCVATAMDLELGLVTGDKGKNVSNGGDKRIHVEVDVIAAGRQRSARFEKCTYL